MDFSLKIKTGVPPSAGKILIAEPLLPDPHFKRSVVFLCTHDVEGSLGFVLNKPIDITLDFFVDGLDNTDIPLFIGGPVDTSSLHILHNTGDLLGGEKIANDISFGGDYQTAIALLKDNTINNNNIRFFIGYSGWSALQLDEEIEKNSWLVSESNQLNLFNLYTEELWEQAILSLDKEFHQLIHLPKDPGLN